MAGEKDSVKQLIFKFFFLLGKLWSIIWRSKLAIFFTELHNTFYSGWLSKNLRSHGSDLKISFPLNYVGLKYISVGDNFTSGARLRLEAHDRFLNQTFHPKIVIGHNVNINFDCHIGCIHEVQIGNNVLIASKVLIMDHSHGSVDAMSIKTLPFDRPLVSKGSIIIGDNVWIGEGCVILAGVVIGANSIIGSNTVVTKSFAANCVIAGNPAKVIKQL
jgi:acetyltransferase-like isoleucine patch superfamily enzyme